jgi:hypothetical protein
MVIHTKGAAMKQCKDCQKTKDRSEFYTRYTSKDGLYSVCKSCHKAKTAAQKRANGVSKSVSVPNRCIPRWLTDGDWMEIKSIYLQAIHLTQASGSRFVVDHIYPLRGKTVSGLHVPSNLRVISEEENRKKYNKMLDTDET